MYEIIQITVDWKDGRVCSCVVGCIVYTKYTKTWSLYKNPTNSRQPIKVPATDRYLCFVLRKCSADHHSCDVEYRIHKDWDWFGDVIYAEWCRHSLQTFTHQETGEQVHTCYKRNSVPSYTKNIDVFCIYYVTERETNWKLFWSRPILCVHIVLKDTSVHHRRWTCTHITEKQCCERDILCKSVFTKRRLHKVRGSRNI